MDSQDLNIKINLLKSELGDIRVKDNINLKDYLLTRQDITARAFYIATTSRELIKVIELCRELKIDFLIIGNGSKISSQTGYFEGLVIKNRSDNLRIFGIKGKVSIKGLGIEEALLEIDSGTSLKRVFEYTNQQRLDGLDYLQSEIGTLGGSFWFDNLLKSKTYQVKVLDQMGDLIDKVPSDVVLGDILISLTFQLKARQ